MFKRRLFIIVCLLSAAATLVAQAQDDQPLTQPTIDAAVSTLLAQTQQAPTQIAVTQTIEAALEGALTATAPSARPAPVDVSTISVVDTTEVDLVAGPARTAAYLAPNGRVYAHLAQALCIYQGAEQQSCVELPEDLKSLDLESVRWSPDSRYLTFTENFFIFFVDPDIWLWDTETGELRDLTDDGSDRSLLTSDTWKNIDVTPDWLPDGRIIFLRYNRINGENLPPELYAIAPDGSDLERLGTIQTTDPISIYGLSAAENRLVYNYSVPGDSVNMGIWTSNPDGSDAQLIMSTTIANRVTGVEASADGRFALVLSQPDNFERMLPEDSWAGVLDIENRQIMLIDPDHYVVGAGWSPEGSALLYLVNNRETPDENGLYVTGAPGEAGRRLLAGDFNLPNLGRWQTLTWGANNSVLLSRSPQRGIVLVQLGE